MGVILQSYTPATQIVVTQIVFHQTLGDNESKSSNVRSLGTDAMETLFFFPLVFLRRQKLKLLEAFQRWIADS